jgi:hypothetical protein
MGVSVKPSRRSPALIAAEPAAVLFAEGDGEVEQEVMASTARNAGTLAGNVLQIWRNNVDLIFGRLPGPPQTDRKISIKDRQVAGPAGRKSMVEPASRFC